MQVCVSSGARSQGTGQCAGDCRLHARGGFKGTRNPGITVVSEVLFLASHSLLYCLAHSTSSHGRSAAQVKAAQVLLQSRLQNVLDDEGRLRIHVPPRCQSRSQLMERRAPSTFAPPTDALPVSSTSTLHAMTTRGGLRWPCSRMVSMGRSWQTSVDVDRS